MQKPQNSFKNLSFFSIGGLDKFLFTFKQKDMFQVVTTNTCMQYHEIPHLKDEPGTHSLRLVAATRSYFNISFHNILSNYRIK